jgi:hypothetical protein
VVRRDPATGETTRVLVHRWCRPGRWTDPVLGRFLNRNYSGYLVPTKADIPGSTARAGRALVAAANKWDLVEEPQVAMALLRERLENRLPHLSRGTTVRFFIPPYQLDPRDGPQ